MSLGAWLKSNTADKILSGVREMIIDRLDRNDTVLEVGCGTGDLLFKAADKIAQGLGVDLNVQMIEYANKKKEQQQYENLAFASQELSILTASETMAFDVSTSTLCLHEMREQEAIDTLKLMASFTSRLIIADYATPRSLWGKLSIELDEAISGHYRRFTDYRKRGGIPYLASMANLESVSVIETPIDGILIWEFRGIREN